MGQDKTDIARFDGYFQAVLNNDSKKQAMGLGSDKPYLPPAIAIEQALTQPWERSPQWQGLNTARTHPGVMRWLEQNNVESLALRAHGYNGWTAAVFEARLHGQSETSMFSMGWEQGRAKHLDRPWNPLLIQPHALGLFVEPVGNTRHTLGLSLFTSKVPMVPPQQPPGLDRFLNQYILRDTPYQVHDHKDLSVMRDGTPIYGDPDSIGFRNRELERRHARDQWKPEWQQQVMRTIHHNSLAAGLPPHLHSVVETAPGSNRFITKQQHLQPAPDGLHLPGRTVVKFPAEDTGPSGRFNSKSGAGKLSVVATSVLAAAASLLGTFAPDTAEAAEGKIRVKNSQPGQTQKPTP